MKKNVVVLIATTVIRSCLSLPTTVEAVGFALEEQSVSNLGYAFAGGAAAWQIRKQTGHKTDAVLGRYIRSTEMFSENVVKTMF